MKMKHMYLAMLGTTGLLLPMVVMAQMDPSVNPGTAQYPQSPQNINLPVPGATGSTPTTGAQASQPTTLRDSLGAPGQTGQEMLDKQFLRNAAQSGMADVKFATLAVQKGSPDVKEMAQKLADDHAEMDKDLSAVADQMDVMLPKKMTKQDQAEYEKLEGLSGKDFDTEYVTYISKAHWQAVHSFYMEASVAANPDLQAVVVKSLGTMHQHFGMIAKVAKDDSITLPPRPPRPAPTTASK